MSATDDVTPASALSTPLPLLIPCHSRWSIGRFEHHTSSDDWLHAMLTAALMPTSTARLPQQQPQGQTEVMLTTPYQQSPTGLRPINEPHRQWLLHHQQLGHQGACSAPWLPFTQPSYPCKAAQQCQLTLALHLWGFQRHTCAQVGVPLGFRKTPTCTRWNLYPGHGYRFSQVQVRIALQYPRVTHDNSYLLPCLQDQDRGRFLWAFNPIRSTTIFLTFYFLLHFFETWCRFCELVNPAKTH